MPAVIFTAPAKINLSLSVLGKRSDGFHEIESLMVPISLADRLTFQCDAAPGLRLTCSDPTLSAGEENLVFRAARQFFSAANLPESAAIHLEKAIPHGAGLGGGSSDAATTLLALNEIHDSPLSAVDLHRLAAALGSDVPFFLARSAALCRGRGEIVDPVDFPERLQLVLVKPGFGVSTPWAYKSWSSSRPLPGIDYGPQFFPWGKLVNDLERPVFEKYLFLAVVKRWLLAQPECAGALMSGSGATCFGVLAPGRNGSALRKRAVETFGDDCRVELCHTLP